MSLKLQIDQLTAGKPGAELKLHLGCGANLIPGWVNTDSTPSPGADYLDFVRPFPLANNMFSAVFCEHTIEHVDKAVAVQMVGEVFRVLRPGGAFRVVTPSLANFCHLVMQPASPAAQKYVAFNRRYTNDPNAGMAEAINRIFYDHGHRHIYMTEELTAMLERAGFKNVRAMRAGTYGNQIFNGVDGHGRVIGEDINAIEAFALEADKP